jgi:hypothetical protein
MNRREFLTILSASFAFFSLSGCLTRKLYTPPQYRETVTSFLISQDGKKLVVLGKNYHYVFDMPPSLKQVLFSSFRKAIDANLYNFNVTTEQIVTGDYLLTIKKNAADKERESAIEAGFVSDRVHGISLSGSLKGIRYSAAGFQAESVQTFNHPYAVVVSEQQTSGQNAAKILLTPITVAADGVLTLAGIPLFTWFLVNVAVHGHE